MIREHDEILNAIIQARLVAIIRGVPRNKIEGIVEALISGGVRILEFTFEHNKEDYLEENADKIRRTVEQYGEQVIVGCGTALYPHEVETAYGAGARLVISPNVNVDVIRRTKEFGMVSMPGALSVTEIVSAWDAGADIVKLFPAGELGLGYVKAIRGPLCHIPMSAVGGVTPETVAEFLDAGVEVLGVGGQLILSNAVKTNDFSAIERRALAFTDAIAGWEDAH